MSPELENDLVDRFPALFALNADWMKNGVTEHNPIACGNGWFSLIENTCLALSDLARHTAKLEQHMGFFSLAPWMPRAAVFTDSSTDQEGQLRFDLLNLMPPTSLTPLTPRTRLTLQAQGMAWMACQMSESICEVCGNPGKYERKRVRCLAHQHILDISDYAPRGVPDARSADPDAKKGAVIKVPTRKRKPQLGRPTPRTEQKVRDLTLYNPWTRMHQAYRLGQDGLVPFYTLGPLSPHDAKRIEKAYKRENSDGEGDGE